jgi:hypothetical protein
MLGESVGVYLDGGPAGEGQPSTIVDCTGETPVTLRVGALSQADIDAALAPEDEQALGTDEGAGGAGTDDETDDASPDAGLDYQPETNPYGSGAAPEAVSSDEPAGFSSAVVVEGELPPPESPSGERPPTA